ncbi:hypothetical protein DTW90_10705 [Neorhizobium sp. P12A]|uniref:S8 family peptidase n=1 Tax=Neorhizobium sp. P12A TaxID=2268027 RepID=UPI0011EC3A37|nr:S8 family serine peptidase [Neorhizobium sp. P12A]KAA0699801.1 hypothetical protein DTW90_10705 [Neorhizobium sp. P12A]
MKKLRSTMSLTDFVSALEEWKTVWRRKGGKRNVAHRRHARNLIRKHTQLYKKATGHVDLPRLDRSFGDEHAWLETPPERTMLLIAPPSSNDDSDDGFSDSQMRRRVRRLVKENLSAGSSTVLDLVNAENAKNKRLPSVAVAANRKSGMRGLYLEALGAAILPELSLADVEALEASGAVVLENTLISLTDPVEEISSDSKNGWHLPVINVTAAREKNLSGSGAIIGILDTGIDASHPEFKGKKIDFRAFEPNGSPSRFVSQPLDFHSHGTHVSAICAGATVGVAPDAEIAVAAVLTKRDAQGRMCGYTNQIVAGINWLARQAGSRGSGVDIINASLGGSNIERKYYSVYNVYRSRGLLTIAAIGNNGHMGIGHHGSPGKFNCVIGVGASDMNHHVAPFSAWGPSYGNTTISAFKPDLVAPGVNIHSALPNALYGPMSGTSQACPQVSGAAALLIQQDPSLRRNADRLANRLLALTCVLPSSPHNADVRRFGYGRLDLASI